MPTKMGSSNGKEPQIFILCNKNRMIVVAIFQVSDLEVVWISDSIEGGECCGFGEHAFVEGLLGQESSARVCLSRHQVHCTRRGNLCDISHSSGLQGI